MLKKKEGRKIMEKVIVKELSTKERFQERYDLHQIVLASKFWEASLQIAPTGKIKVIHNA